MTWQHTPAPWADFPMECLWYLPFGAPAHVVALFMSAAVWLLAAIFTLLSYATGHYNRWPNKGVGRYKSIRASSP